MLSPAVLFAAGVSVAVMCLPRTSGHIGWSRSIRKTLPVALFALAALGEGAPVLLSVALALSAVGDLALSRPGNRAFLAGMIAFASAHLAYIALMLGYGSSLQLADWPLILVLVFFGLSTEWWLCPHTGALKWPVRGYVGIILAMGLMALGLPDRMWLAFVGAMLFVVSDLILSIETFVLPRDHKMRKLADKAVWIIYIAAQTGLFLGLGVFEGG